MIIPLLSSLIDKGVSRNLLQGTVVDNKDPLRKSRVRVTIPGVNDSIPVDKLPWYIVLTSGNNSNSRVLPLESRVILKYNSIYNSIVIGTTSSTTPS